MIVKIIYFNTCFLVFQNAFKGGYLFQLNTYAGLKNLDTYEKARNQRFFFCLS